MKLDEILKKVPLVFHLVGESCIVLDKDLNKKSICNVLRYIPVLISILITTCLSTCVFKGVLEIRSDTPQSQKTENIVFAICFSCRAMTKVCASIGVLFLQNHFSALYIHFKHFEIITNRQFEMNFTDFLKRYLHQVGILVGLWVISFILVVLIMPSSIKFYAMLNIFLLTILLLARITQFHVLFYVNLLRKCLSHFLDHVKRKANVYLESKVSNDISRELYFLKKVHFKLWEITQVLNTVFAWTLATLMLQHFVDLIYHTYWIFLNTETCAWNTLRK